VKIARVQGPSGPQWAVVQGDQVFLAGSSPFEGGIRHVSEVQFLAPCEPSKIVAIGLNYASHARESGAQIPPEPLMFFKPSTSVIGPGADILWAPGSQRIDYEAELAVVIKKTAQHVPADRWREYVLGYTCANDVSARDFQRGDGQWSRAKGSDTFCPLGPWIETDLDPSDLRIVGRLNGEVRQEARTADLAFGIPALIAHITRYFTLLPGDVILTGTPAGIGPLQPGDVYEVEIEGVGTLRNRIVRP